MTQPEISKKMKTALLCAGLCVFVWLWRCPFYWIWGFPCPGCGMTRALLAFCQGDFAQSLAMHAMLVPAGLALVLGLFIKKGRKKILYGWLAAMLVYYIYRLLFMWGVQPMTLNKQSLLLKAIFFVKKAMGM